MGRLIDAGLVLDNLSGRLESMKDYDAVKDAINNIPTAYDVDKVVGELKTDSSAKLYGSGNSNNYLIPLDRAIEIVKAGGNA